MLTTELLEIVANGENSGVEFKRDVDHADSIAKELAALANLEGGRLFLGVGDDRIITGITRSEEDAEEWVMNLCRNNLQPSVIPYWETVTVPNVGIVGVVTLPDDMPDKPYKAKRGGAWVTMIRVGSTSRDASREEEARLYQSGGTHRYEIRKVSGASVRDLDGRRLADYFDRVREVGWPNDEEAQRTLLLNTEILVEADGHTPPTVAGMLLFGRNPRRFLPQSALDAEAYPGIERDYAATERTTLDGPLVSLFDTMGESVESGLIEKALAFARRNLAVQSEVDERTGVRHDREALPYEPIREAIVNACAHRDYAITTVTTRLSLFSDRLEVLSPGRLTNTVTVAKMLAGYRATRNELVKEVLRDYRYVEASGLGVPRKIVRGMEAFNGSRPILVEEDESFRVTLLK